MILFKTAFEQHFYLNRNYLRCSNYLTDNLNDQELPKFSVYPEVFHLQAGNALELGEYFYKMKMSFMQRGI